MSAMTLVPTGGAESPRRRLLAVVPDPVDAEVLSIDSAPSARRRRRAQLAEEPAMRRRPAAPRAGDRAIRVPLGRFLIHGAVVVSLGLAGVGAGILVQPDAYAGPTRVHSVVAGDSMWSLAQGVDTDRPLEEVVVDIERLNGLDGALVQGQRVLVPVR
ncbi:LysM peptidoglycan-binding domain-containing protein [Actinomyces sp. B33]|uniref:LysM peptidoglycan-binding domain-containing protein n=1 Tax=Actinomyces sp. B33 TaxID=2942131 RepID=UPI00233F87A4|nr:LysM peptidoglycan-binding domain-containing protein [Actinomyces sp. B33]MDC4233065.1 LysM peptidoglycan-binding domain-containing protein [Actinomyces sp. B33]